MPAGGFKTFTSGEILTAADVNAYLMQGVLVFAGTAARGSAIPSPVEGQASFRTDEDAFEVYDGTAWVEVGGGAPILTNADVSATTGSPTTGTYSSGGVDYAYYEFTGSGSITLDKGGLVDVLVLGGGGGGAGPSGRGLAGGGAGGHFYLEGAYIPAGTVTVTVGAGGPAGPEDCDGFSSVLLPYFGVGGGGGGRYDPSEKDSSGGSGSGGYGGPSGDQGDGGHSLQPGYGNNGGAGFGSSSSNAAGGGGGGAGAAGGAASNNLGGDGGNGLANSITGSSVTRGGGGAGASGNAVYGTAGTGGGGSNSAGTVNTGGGGSGNFGGGSGLVVVRVRQ